MQERLLLFARLSFFTIPQIPVLIVKAEHGLSFKPKGKGVSKCGFCHSLWPPYEKHISYVAMMCLLTVC
jgi:hypothetical protein